MVLQRIQSVYLLLATILMAVFACFPVYSLTDGDVVTVVGVLAINGVTQQSWLLLALDALIVVLTFVTIFKYHNLKFQIKLAGILMFLQVTLMVCLGVMMSMTNCPTVVSVLLPVACPVLALVFTFLARRGMNHDKKLLYDSERIR